MGRYRRVLRRAQEKGRQVGDSLTAECNPVRNGPQGMKLPSAGEIASKDLTKGDGDGKLLPSLVGGQPAFDNASLDRSVRLCCANWPG
jgi:hypothetical protein